TFCVRPRWAFQPASWAPPPGEPREQKAAAPHPGAPAWNSRRAATAPQEFAGSRFAASAPPGAPALIYANLPPFAPMVLSKTFPGWIGKSLSLKIMLELPGGVRPTVEPASLPVFNKLDLIGMEQLDLRRGADFHHAAHPDEFVQKLFLAQSGALEHGQIALGDGQGQAAASRP